KTTGEESVRALRLASEQALRYGLTSLTEPGVLVGGARGVNAPVLGTYQTAIETGALRPRMTVMRFHRVVPGLQRNAEGTRAPYPPPIEPWALRPRMPGMPFHRVLHGLELNAEGMRTLDLGMRTGFGDDRLRLGPVKIISDGSLIGRTAAVHDCFCGERDNRGVMVVDPDELLELVPSFHRAGWTVAAHAIGDRAIDHALDAVAAARREHPRPVRHRIEHFAIATDEQVRRCAGLGVVPVPQGAFISEFGDGILSAIGERRARGACRMRSLLDAGMVVPGSTDSPVADANPFVS